MIRIFKSTTAFAMLFTVDVGALAQSVVAQVEFGSERYVKTGNHPDARLLKISNGGRSK